MAFLLLFFAFITQILLTIRYQQKYMKKSWAPDSFGLTFSAFYKHVATILNFNLYFSDNIKKAKRQTHEDEIICSTWQLKGELQNVKLPGLCAGLMGWHCIFAPWIACNHSVHRTYFWGDNFLFGACWQFFVHQRSMQWEERCNTRLLRRHCEP